MTTTAQDIDLLEHEAGLLLDFLRTLPNGAWQTASACEGWTVADVVGHLTSVDLSSRLLRGLDGDYSAPAGAPAPEQHDEDSFAQSIYRRAIDASQRLGDGLLADFTERVNETVTLFRRVQPRPVGQPGLLAARPNVRANPADSAHRRVDHARVGHPLTAGRRLPPFRRQRHRAIGHGGSGRPPRVSPGPAAGRKAP